MRFTFILVLLVFPLTASAGSAWIQIYSEKDVTVTFDCDTVNIPHADNGPGMVIRATSMGEHLVRAYKKGYVTQVDTLFIPGGDTLSWRPDTFVVGSSKSNEKIDNTAGAEQFPGPDEFVPMDKPPELIYKGVPEYPEKAREEGLEADVFVRVLIDRKGIVRDVMVLKSSIKDSGFEDAAIISAYESKFNPAVHNGSPIATWVMYRIDFALDKK